MGALRYSHMQPRETTGGEGRELATLARMSAAQRAWRRRFEALIGLAAPALDLVLAVGDRASRLLASEDYDYYPVRSPGEVELAPPGSLGDGEGSAGP